VLRKTRVFDPYDTEGFARRDQRLHMLLFLCVLITVGLVVLFAAYGPELIAKLIMRDHGL
jgi:hypothetical protein